MKVSIEDFKNNPSFNNVLNLTNRTFDGNIVSGRGATEDQLLVIYNKIKEVKDWLDDGNCSDDVYVYLRQLIEELAVQIQTCCAIDHSEGVTNSLFNRIDDLESQIQTCCTVDHGGDAVQILTDRIAQLEDQIQACCDDFNRRVEEIIKNIQNIPNTGESTGGNILINDKCDEGLVEVDYSVDFSKIARKGPTTQSDILGVMIGNASAQINATDGRKIYRYWFQGVKDSNPTTYHSNLSSQFRMAQYPDAVVRINPIYGTISVHQYSECPQEENVYDGNAINLQGPCDNWTGGVNTDVTRPQERVGPLTISVDSELEALYLTVWDSKGCSWSKEIPLSSLVFPNYNNLAQ